jgi:type VI secretion system protein ImpG
MLESLLPYYERELGYLRELSGEFALRYPKIAGRLQLEGEQCADPHTERLLESFAFLAARIHKKYDDEYPEVVTSLLDVLYPHYQQPMPSGTIVQFEYDEESTELSGRYHIERGTVATAPAIDGTICKFRSCYPVDLYPVTLSAARLELTGSSPYLRSLAPDAAAVLTLELTASGGALIGTLGLDRLRFFLDGEPASMHLLYELLLSKVMRVQVCDGSDDPARSKILPASAIQPVGFDASEGMLDYDERSFSGYHLLSEFFCYPDKFLFVDLEQLGQVTALAEGQQLVIRFFLSAYPDSERHHRLLDQLRAEHFKLGCTPMINLFTQAGEPINVTHQQASYPVQAKGSQPTRYEVISLRSVRLVGKEGESVQDAEVPPFYALRHGSEDGRPRFYWHATREQSVRPNDKGTDLSLHLVDLEFTPVRPEGETLSLDLLCSNRDVPLRIPFGGSQALQRTDFALTGFRGVKRVRLLRKPGATQRPALKRGTQWRLISHLTLNYLSIVDSGREALQEMLALYNRSDSLVNRRQIQGIVDIESGSATKLLCSKEYSGFVRGTEVRLTLNEENYVGCGWYLFASVLERFFALYCSPNSFSRLRVFSAGRGEEIAAWPARAGTALVI